jgi:hypothetical protein
MSASPVSLDQGPPLPQQLAPQPSVSQLAGPQNGQAQQSGSASLLAQVAQKAMFCEQAMNDIATMMPAASGMISGWIDTFRKGLSSVLAQGATPPPAQGQMGGSASMLMGGPSGGAGQQPSS